MVQADALEAQDVGGVVMKGHGVLADLSLDTVDWTPLAWSKIFLVINLHIFEACLMNELLVDIFLKLLQQLLILLLH